MYKALIKTQLSLRIASLLPRKGNNKVGFSKFLGVFIVILYVFGAAGVIVGLLLNFMAKALLKSDMGWSFYVIVGLIYILIGLVGSIFSSKSFMFDSKDNELLLSMPLTPRAILACRVAVLFMMNFMFSLIVSIPCLYVCSKYREINAVFLIRYFIAWLLLVFLSVAFTCVFGLIIGYLSSKIRRKYIATTVITLSVLAGMYFLGANFSKYGSWIMNNAGNIAGTVKKVIPPIYYFGQVCFYGKMSMILSQALWCIIPFLVTFFALSAVYFKILTTNKGVKTRKYKDKHLFALPAVLTLTKKELKRIFTITVYLINSSLGIFMHVIIIITLLTNPLGILNLILSIKAIRSALPVVIVYMLCFSVATNCTTSCSISIEGENIWILKSLPIGAGKVMISKILANMIISCPTLIALQITVCHIFTLKQNEIIYIIAIPILAQLLTAMIGLFCNLLLPKMHWTNPNEPVKQSAAVLINMVASLLITAGPALLYFLVLKGKMDAGLFLSFTMLYYMAICILFGFLLATIGKVRYKSLNY